MLTLILLTLMNNSGVELIVPMVIKQIAFGLAIGFILAKLSVYILRHSNFEIEGFYTIFITAIAILSYAFSEYLGGNGYLSVYISGIIIGNSRIPLKKVWFISLMEFHGLCK